MRLFGWLRRPPHKADEYFRQKRASTRDGWALLSEAYLIRHHYPDLSGSELVRLIYWGASGVKEED